MNYDPKGFHDRADVYSLAKTLWVVATGQQHPLPGHHDKSYRQICVESFVNDSRAHLVDDIIAAATTIDPMARLTMEELARELEKTMEESPRPNPHPIDLSTYALRAAQANRNFSAESSRIDAINKSITALNEDFRPHVDTLYSYLEQLRGDFNLQYGDGSVVRQTPGVNRVKYAIGREVAIQARPPAQIVLHSGFGAMATTDYRIVLLVGHVIEMWSPSNRRECVWRELREMPMGSTLGRIYIPELGQLLLQNTEAAVRRLIDVLESQAKNHS